MRTNQGGQFEAHASGGEGLIAGDVVLVHQSVPALNLLVLVLQTLIPVLQVLSLGGDTQLTPTCQEGMEVWRCDGQVRITCSLHESSDAAHIFTYVVVGLPNVVIPHRDV